MNRFHERLRRQGREGEAPPAHQAGVDEQARDARRSVDPRSPPPRRRVFSQYDSRPLGALEWIFAPPTAPAVLLSDNTTRWRLTYNVPAGRVLIVRSVTYDIAPHFPVQSFGYDGDVWRLTLRAGGAEIFGFSDIRMAPWDEPLALFAIVPGGQALDIDVLANAVFNDADNRMHAIATGQLLVDTGEPAEQLVGHARQFLERGLEP